MRVFVIFIFLAFVCLKGFSKESTSSKTISPQKKRAQLLKLIENEMQTIMSIASYKKLGAKLNHRLINIYSEKIKIIKEIENEKFLSSGNNNKSLFFKQSKKLVREINKHAFHIQKRHPRYKRMDHVYFVQGIIDRDYGPGKKSIHFLKKALQKSVSFKRTNSKIHYDIVSSIAEHYYNKKSYKSAIKYYGKVLKYKNQSWYTKNLYNTAWCFFKINKYNKAIEYLNQSFEHSKDKKYIDFSKEIFSSAGVFYSKANKVKDGLSFFVKNSPSIYKHLVAMAKTNESFGKLEDTQYILDYIGDQNLNIDESLIFLNYSLAFYRNVKKKTKHLNTVVAINKFRESNVKEIDKIEKTKHWKQIIEKITDYSGLLQSIFVKNYNYYRSYDEQKLKVLLQYFTHLKTIDPDLEYKYSYFIGETYLTLKKHDQAFSHYQEAMGNIVIKDKISNQEFAKKIMDSMYVCFEKRNYYNTNYERASYLFKSQLTYWPKSKKSLQVFPRIIYLNLKYNKPNLAEKWFDTFEKSKTTKNQVLQPIAKDLVSYHLKNSNILDINRWISILQKGRVALPKSYTKEVINDLSIILFKKSDKFESKGSFTESININNEVFENKTYHSSIKAKAAIKLSALNLKSTNTNKSADWLKEYIEIASLESLNDVSKAIRTILEEYELLQDFESSSEVVSELLSKHCNNKLKFSHEYLKISTKQLLTGGMIEDSIDHYRKYQKCIKSNKQKNRILQSISNQILLSHDIKVANYFIKKTPSIKANFKNYFYEQTLYGLGKSDLSFSKNAINYSLKHYPKDNRINELQKLFTLVTNTAQIHFNFPGGTFDLKNFENSFEKNIALLEKTSAKISSHYKTSPFVSYLAQIEQIKLNKKFYDALNSINYTFSDDEMRKHVLAQINHVKRSFQKKIKANNLHLSKYIRKSKLNFKAFSKNAHSSTIDVSLVDLSRYIGDLHMRGAHVR